MDNINIIMRSQKVKAINHFCHIPPDTHYFDIFDIYLVSINIYKYLLYYKRRYLRVYSLVKTCKTRT